MTDDDQNQPPDDSVVPWHPGRAYAHLAKLRDQLTRRPELAAEPADPLNVALTVLEYTACPHPECPLLLLDPHPH